MMKDEKRRLKHVCGYVISNTCVVMLSQIRVWLCQLRCDYLESLHPPPPNLAVRHAENRQF